MNSNKAYYSYRLARAKLELVGRLLIVLGRLLVLIAILVARS